LSIDFKCGHWEELYKPLIQSDKPYVLGYNLATLSLIQALG